MNYKKLAFYTIILGIIMSIAGLFGQFVLTPLINPNAMQEYQSGAYRSWADPLMSYIFIHPFVLALLMSLAYFWFGPFENIKKPCKRGLYFGLSLWLLMTVPGMLMTYSSFSESFVSGAMVLLWTIDSLLKFSVAGIVLMHLENKK